MERGTRWHILQEVHRKRRVGVEDLARSLGVRPATIHHHLPKLEREGFIYTEEERHGQGRPRLVCSLTQQGQDLFPLGYRWLVQELLETIATLEGRERGEMIFQEGGEGLAERYPQVCAMEQRLISTLLGEEIQRTQYRLAGAPLCTYLVTHPN